MKSWQCSGCKIPRAFLEGDGDIIMKICLRCGRKMEVINESNNSC